MPLPPANQGNTTYIPSYLERQASTMQYNTQEEIDAKRALEAKLQAESKVRQEETRKRLQAEAARTPEQKAADLLAAKEAYAKENPTLLCPECGLKVEKLDIAAHVTKAFGKCIIDEKRCRQSGMTQDAIDSYNDARTEYLNRVGKGAKENQL